MSDVEAPQKSASAVQQKRNWTSIIISSVVGGGFAIIMAPTVAALMPVGAAGYVAGTVITGVLGSVTTKVTGNAIDADSVTLIINQYPIQQFYRETVLHYVGTTLESVFTCLRTNIPYEFKSTVAFDIAAEMSFQGLDAKEKRQMFFEFSFRVIPLGDKQKRAIDESIPAPQLPTYAKDAKRNAVSTNNKGLLDGTGRAVVEGAAFGLVGGALGRTVPKLAGRLIVDTVPSGSVNMIFGMSSATAVAGPVRNLVYPPSEPDRAALFVEFATEVQCHLNQLVACAAANHTGLEFDMKIGSKDKLEMKTEPGPHGSGSTELYWSVAGTVNKTMTT